MKTAQTIKYVAILPVIAFSLLFASPTQAETQVLTAIPPKLEFGVKPGEFVKKTVQFRNEGETTVTLTAVTKDFIVQQANGKPEFVGAAASGRWASSSWIKPFPGSFTVAPKQTVDITLSISVPKDALPGGHYAGVLYEAKSTLPRIAGAGSGITQVVGTLVYITVEGPITENVLLQAFTAPNFLEFGPVNFSTEMQNLSDVHVAPKGQIVVRDMLGKTVSTLPLEERNIFPGSIMKLSNTLDMKYMLGRYRADLSYTYGSQGHMQNAVLYFTVFPVRLASAVILAIVLVVLIILFLTKKREEEVVDETPEVKK